MKRNPRPSLHLQQLESRAVPATLVNASTVTCQDLDGDDVTVKFSKPVFVNITINSVLTFTSGAGAVKGNNNTKERLQSIDITKLGNPADLNPNFADFGNWLALCLNAQARVMATNPEPARHDPAHAVSLAKEAVELRPREGIYWNTLGVAHYRARDWKAAIAALDKSMELRKGGVSSDWFFLATAHWQVGDKDKTRELYDRAVQWMDKNQPKKEELRRFRAEAAALLELNEKK